MKQEGTVQRAQSVPRPSCSPHLAKIKVEKELQARAKSVPTKSLRAHTPLNIKTFKLLKRKRDDRIERARAAYGGEEDHSPDTRVNKAGKRVPLAHQSKANQGLLPWNIGLEAAETLCPKLVNIGFLPEGFLDPFACPCCAVSEKHSCMTICDLDR